MSDDSPELVLLRQTLLSIYRDVAPDASVGGEFLIRKLAAQLYARGARISIGIPVDLPSVTIHQSVDPDQRLVWTCKHWNQTMGYRNGAMVGHHLSEILAPESWPFYKESYWPELVKTGKVSGAVFTLVTRAGERLPATARSDILRDSAGDFLRTFTKIKTRIPLLVPLLFAACTSDVASVPSAELARERRPEVHAPLPDQPIKKRGVFRRPKLYVSVDHLHVGVV